MAVPSSPPFRPGPRYDALIQLLRTADAIWNASRIFFRKWRLSPSQFNLLHVLRSHPGGLSQAELSRELLMHRSNMTGLIDRLTAAGLVQRLRTSGDRRVHRIVATAAGRRLIGQILPHYYRQAEEAWGNFPPTQARAVAQALTDLAQNVTTITAALEKNR